MNIPIGPHGVGVYAVRERVSLDVSAKNPRGKDTSCVPLMRDLHGFKARRKLQGARSGSPKFGPQGAACFPLGYSRYVYRNGK